MAEIQDSILQDVSLIFNALGDVSRLKLLKVLMASQEPIHQGGLADATGLSNANVSRHLALLFRHGLVTRERQGNFVKYRAVLPLIPELCDRVCTFVITRIAEDYHSLKPPLRLEGNGDA